MTSSDSDTDSFYDAEDRSSCSAGSVRCEISSVPAACWGGGGLLAVTHCQCQSVRLSVSVTLLTLLQRVQV